MKYILMAIITFATGSINELDNIVIMQNQITGFQYETYTRGSQYQITVTSDKILVRQTGLNSFHSQSSTPSDLWSGLIDLIKKISLEDLETYKSPSSSRALDAAPHAVIKILTGNKNYKSATFDHGNPPKEIESLVKAILTLAETVEKQ